MKSTQRQKDSFSINNKFSTDLRQEVVSQIGFYNLFTVNPFSFSQPDLQATPCSLSNHLQNHNLISVVIGFRSLVSNNNVSR